MVGEMVLLSSYLRGTKKQRCRSRRTGGFKVTRKFHGIMKYPLNIMMLFINFEKEIGDDLQGGLTKLKQIMKQD